MSSETIREHHEAIVEEAANREAWKDDPLTVVSMVLPTTSHARAALDALYDAGWRVVRVVDEWKPDDDG